MARLAVTTPVFRRCLNSLAYFVIGQHFSTVHIVGKTE